MKTQPERTKMNTSHKINYKGFEVVIKGKHSLLFSKNGKMDFTFYIGENGRNYGNGSRMSLKQKLDEFIEFLKDAEVKEIKSEEFRNLHKSLNNTEKIAHSKFIYARFNKNSFGDFYNIYWKNDLSPTGVEMVVSISVEEWETISEKTGNKHNYLEPRNY